MATAVDMMGAGIGGTAKAAGARAAASRVEARVEMAAVALAAATVVAATSAVAAETEETARVMAGLGYATPQSPRSGSLAVPKERLLPQQPARWRGRMPTGRVGASKKITR